MTKMKANMADAPYVTHKEITTWHFQLTYAGELNLASVIVSACAFAVIVSVSTVTEKQQCN